MKDETDLQDNWIKFIVNGACRYGSLKIRSKRLFTGMTFSVATSPVFFSCNQAM